VICSAVRTSGVNISDLLRMARARLNHTLLVQQIVDVTAIRGTHNALMREDILVKDCDVLAKQGTQDRVVLSA
jgi:hypothetical protein